MKLKLDIETHRDKAGNWVAQVLLAGQVLHEQHGPVSEQQAISNVTSSFASLLATLIQNEDERQVAEFEAVHGT